MKKTFALNAACFAIVLLIGSSTVNANDAIKKQILELFPQADTNKDGAISDAEEAALSRQALKRYPKADKDGDGVLSDAEKKALLRLAANRAKRKPAGATTDNLPPAFFAIPQVHCALTWILPEIRTSNHDRPCTSG